MESQNRKRFIKENLNIKDIIDNIKEKILLFWFD
jgi:hypothetical protein